MCSRLALVEFDFLQTLPNARLGTNFGVHNGSIEDLTGMRHRQEKRIVIEREWRWREVKVDVGREPEPRDAIPQAFRTVRIMVAGQQMPMNVGKRLHALDRRAKRMRIGSLAVLNVAGNKNVMNAVALGNRAKTFDGRETRLPQRFFLGAEFLEDLADLPVGGMNEPHDVSPLRSTLPPPAPLNQKLRCRCGFPLIRRHRHEPRIEHLEGLRMARHGAVLGALQVEVDRVMERAAVQKAQHFRNR